MPTQIIDNFDLTSQLPLDARLVVGPNAFFQTKDAIQNKYYGLRVWDFNENLPFVWTGSAWENENSGSVLVSNGQGGFVSKFTGTGTSNTITKSSMYEFVSGSIFRVGIGVTSPTETLQVAGNIKSTGSTGFIGSGGSITAINATNISSGSLSLARLFTTGAGSNSILSYNGSIATWKLPTQIRVASATGIEITTENTSSSSFDLIFYRTANIVGDGLTPTSYKVSSSTSRLQFKPSTSQLLLANGDQTNPSLSFVNSQNVGIYYDNTLEASYNGITFTINQNSGSKRLTIRAAGYTGNFASTLALYSNSTSKRFEISEFDNSDTSFQQIGGSGTIYFQNQNIFRVESAVQITSTLNVGSSITATGDITTNNNLFNYQKAVIGGTALDTSGINARLLVVANGVSGAALFTSNQWSNTGHQSTIYIGDSGHYIRSNYLGTFDIKSGDSIKLISGSSTRVFLNNLTGSVGIGTENPTSRLTVNGNIRTDSDFVTGTDTAGWNSDVVVYGQVKQFNTADSTWNPLNITSGSVFRWKIIGKTLILKFYIETTGHLGANGGVFQVRIPTALQSIIKNHKPSPSGHEIGYQLEDSIIMAPAYGYLWAQLRKYTDEGFPNEWILYMNNLNSSYTAVDGGDFRGSVILELI